MLRAHVAENGERVLYQEGPVTAMLDPLDLIERFAGKAGLAEGTLMFCGTLAAHGGVRPSDVSSSSSTIRCSGGKSSIATASARLPVLG